MKPDREAARRRYSRNRQCKNQKRAYLVAGLVHGGHAGAVVLAGEACDVDLERHRPHRRPEVEEAELADAQPVGQVARVGQRRREADDAQGAGRVRRDEVGAGDDDLEGIDRGRTSGLEREIASETKT